MEGEYCIANGHSHDAEIIYGDTDSVMVRFGPTDLAKVMDLGMSPHQASSYVSNGPSLQAEKQPALSQPNSSNLSISNLRRFIIHIC